jgi:26S proteasome regulatory subunit N8
MMMSVYLAAIMRTVVSLHSLIENKEARASTERAVIAAEAKAAEGAGKANGENKEKEKENKDEQNGAAKGDSDNKMDET